MRPHPGDIIAGSVAFQFYLYDIQVSTTWLQYQYLAYDSFRDGMSNGEGVYHLDNPYDESGIIT